MATTGVKIVASNRKARHDYTILETIEAGIVLHGSEVKSLRNGEVQLADAFARIENGECWMEGVRIAPYPFANGFDAHDPDRRRKLLLHRDEMAKLDQEIALQRIALVPLTIYFKDGTAKVELAVAKGRRKGDHRQAMAERDAKMEAAKALGRQRKGMAD